MKDQNALFTNNDQRAMIVPLFLEQLLVMLVGIAIAMVCDWVIRAVIFVWRQRSGKWKEFKVV